MARFRELQRVSFAILEDPAAHDGLWLVEPHSGKDGVGEKWEEILVIDNGKAYCLDETPPHVRQWAQI